MNLGQQHSPETKEKIRATRLGTHASEETRAKLRKRHAERRAAGIPGPMTGKHLSSITIEKMRKRHAERRAAGIPGPNSGKHPTVETRAKLSAAGKLRKLSLSHRAAISAAGKKRYASPEAREAARQKWFNSRANWGSCEGCGKEGRRYKDHDHVTDKFRGLLCHRCNSALGYAKDRPEVLRKLATYLEKS